jgi:hypothetical protein
VIVRDGAHQLFYDHWCAGCLDRELLWGPALATAFVEQLRPVDPVEGWLDDVWAEGAAVIDHDQQVLLWFGGQDLVYDLPLRKAVVALLAHTWPGWEVRWAQGHIEAIARYLGVPLDRVRTEACGDPDAFCIQEDDPEWNDVLVTVRKGSERRCLGVYGEADALLLGPSGLLPLLDAAPTRTEWGDFPQGGIHLELDQQVLLYWRAEPLVSRVGAVRLAWPGWTVEDAGDRVEAHLERLDDPPSLPVGGERELQRGFLEQVRSVGWRKGSNPAAASAARLPGQVDLNPATEAFRDSAGEPAVREAILLSLEALVR